MPNARGSIFVFVFGALGISALVALAAFITENNVPTSSIATNASEYFQSSSVVNHTQGFVQNVTVTGLSVISPMPLLLAILAFGACLLVFLLVVKK
jgi:hypothetical protein